MKKLSQDSHISIDQDLVFLEPNSMSHKPPPPLIKPRRFANDDVNRPLLSSTRTAGVSHAYTHPFVNKRSPSAPPLSPGLFSPPGHISVTIERPKAFDVDGVDAAENAGMRVCLKHYSSAHFYFVFALICLCLCRCKEEASSC